MAEDDFSSQLASLDRSQLKDLLQYLNQTNAAEQQVGGGSYNGLNRSMSNFFQSDNGTRDNIKNVVSNFSGYGMYKKHMGKKKDDAAADAYAMAQMQAVATQKTIDAERRRAVENQLKTLDLRDKTQMQFRDLGLNDLFDQITKKGLDSSVLGITQQHDDIARETGFGAVSRGIGGGSADAERISDIQSSQEQAIARAAAQAQGQNSQLKSQAEKQQNSLLASISGGNPGEDARLHNEIQGIGQNANSFGQTVGGLMYGDQLGAQQMAGQSQALGGLLTNYANLYTQSQRQQYPNQNQNQGG